MRNNANWLVAGLMSVVAVIVARAHDLAEAEAPEGYEDANGFHFAKPPEKAGHLNEHEAFESLQHRINRA